MLVKATTAFVGKVCMAKGDVREINEGEHLNSLLKAGYVKPEGAIQTAQENTEPEGGDAEQTEDTPEITEVKPVEAKRGKAK